MIGPVARGHCQRVLTGPLFCIGIGCVGQQVNSPPVGGITKWVGKMAQNEPKSVAVCSTQITVCEAV